MVAIPALAKILVIFALIVVAAARRIHLGLAAAVGGIALAAWQGMPVSAIALALAKELTNPDLILLVILLTGIMMFSAAMKKSGAMDAFSNAIAESAPSRRIALAVAPLLIGTLPMPGGAIISAPLVGAMNDDDGRGPETLSAINYWFRHVLELVWPLFPAFILTVGLTNLSVMQLVLLNLYAPVAIYVLGLLFILPRPEKAVTGTPEPEKVVNAAFLHRAKFGRLMRGIAPLATVLGSYVVLDILWELVAPGIPLDTSAKSLLGRYMPVLCGLAIGAFYLQKHTESEKIFRNSISASTIELIAVIIGIRLFSALIGAADLAHAASMELANAGIPAIFVIALLPFISGIVTGVGMGYVGLSLPIVLGLLASSDIPFKAGVVIAGAFGYSGMMLSPLHVCMVVTAQHFKTTLPATIRKFALPLGIFLVIAVAYTAILSIVLR